MKAKDFARAATVAFAGTVAWTMGAALPAAAQQTHELKANPSNVHIGHFSAAIKPVLTVNSGDIVSIDAVTHIDPVQVEQSGVVPPADIPDNHRAIYREVKDRGPGVHVMVGPVYVNGAEPGDT